MSEIASNPGVPEVKDLTQDQKDAILSKYEAAGGKLIAGIVEKNLKEREALLEQQFERRKGVLAALGGYAEATKGVPVMGALFQALARNKGVARGDDAAFGRVGEMFEKSVGPDLAKTVNLGTADEGGILIEGTVLELWLEPLRAASVVLSLQPEIIPVTGDTLRVTGFETDPAITWVEEENSVAVTTTPTTGARQTTMRKAMAIMPVTSDYRESASPMILRRLEDLMRNAFRVGFDLRYITGTGLANTVTGLRNLITATTATAGQTLAQCLTDAETAINAIETTNIAAERLGIIWNPRSKNHLMLGALDADNKPFFYEEIKAGTWLGYPWRTTTSVPINLGGGLNESYVIWCAFNQLFIGQSTALDVQWFMNASYTEGGALVSSVERDTEVLRGRQKTATLMPRPTGGFVTTGVLWGT